MLAFSSGGGYNLVTIQPNYGFRVDNSGKLVNDIADSGEMLLSGFTDIGDNVFILAHANDSLLKSVKLNDVEHASGKSCLQQTF